MSSSPIVKATFQSVILAVISNVLAQTIQAYQSGRELKLDTAPIVQFIVFTIINVPPNFLWQEYLEEQFPGYTTSRTNDARDSTKGETRDTPAKEERKLNIRNTAMKFILDQTVGCVVNTVFFIAAMEAIKGKSTSAIMEAVQRDTWPLMLASYKLWPFVSILSFTVIPVEQRVVFGGVIGVGWGVFLSLFSNP